MLDYLAYLTAQRQVRDLATSALPGAPVHLDPQAPAGPGRHLLRRRAAQALVRAAQWLEPVAVAHGSGSDTPTRAS
jgi:hypothetical protein